MGLRDRLKRLEANIGQPDCPACTVTDGSTGFAVRDHPAGCTSLGRSRDPNCLGCSPTWEYLHCPVCGRQVVFSLTISEDRWEDQFETEVAAC
jgi:hypothetical protein